MSFKGKIFKEEIKLLTSADLRRLTITAVLLALAIIVNLFEYNFTLAGAPIMRIRLGNVFLRFIAVISGGIYGGIAGVLNDVICHFSNPKGPWLPFLTIVEFLKGFSIGLLWLGIKKVNISIFNIIYAVVAGICVLFGCIMIFLNGFAPDSILFLCVGLVSLAVIVPAHLSSKRSGNIRKNQRDFNLFLKLFTATAIPCIVFEIVNTFAFRYVYSITEKAFLIYLMPRLAKEIILIIANTYILTVLLRVYESVFARRKGFEEA